MVGTRRACHLLVRVHATRTVCPCGQVSVVGLPCSSEWRSKSDRWNLSGLGRGPRMAVWTRLTPCSCNAPSLPAADYAAMCRAARERVRRLDWRNVVEQNTAVYQDLVERKRSATATGRRPAPVWTPWLTALSTATWGWHDLTTRRIKHTTASTP